jgi:hypothetical protein
MTARIGISKRISWSFTLRGRISAVTPKMSPTLKMLEPRTLPRDTPEFALRAALTLTASSGELVPQAMTVSPTTRGGIPKRREIDTAPRMNASAPQ